MTAPATLVGLLRARAAERPEAVAYTFLRDGESEEGTLTFGELDRRARSVGAAVRDAGGEGERALLVYAPGLDFVAAFFGCLYGGATAVPVYPPLRKRSGRTLSRFRSILADAEPRLILTTTAGMARSARLLDRAALDRAPQWVDTEIASQEAAEWQPPDADPGAAALLQYTSGSTAAPKGVVVSHANILHNERLIRDAFGQDESSVVVGWLPFYHDMGLIGNLLQPLYAGCRSVLMSPLSFLQRPVRWLRAISRYRGTTSGGPSFAYDLARRRTRPEQCEGLDLSSWRVAFNGSEPVRAEVMAEFCAVFEPYGFRREAFYPCYGLAEATLLVTARGADSVPRELTVDAAELERHRVVAARLGRGVRTLVSCGRPDPGQRVVIVDPASRKPCAPERVGEIWVAGASVAGGYWKRLSETEHAFGARLADDEDGGPYLRTGDLGFVGEGELFVTGRLKDLIIIRGKNHYPQDIEWTVEPCHPALRRGACAAFSVDAEDEERLVVAVEIDRRYERGHRGRAWNPAAVTEAVRRAVAEGHGLEVWAVVLLKAGGLPKTTSGKIERHACRAGFLDGSLPVLERSVLEPVACDWHPEELAREALLAVDEDERRRRLSSYLRRQVASVRCLDPASLDPEQALTALGLDSLAAIELSNRIEDDLGIPVAAMPLLRGLSLEQLVEQVTERLGTAGAVDLAVGGEGPPPAEYPLSRGQEALWFLQRLAPESTPYNISAAARVPAALDVEAFERALGTLVDRHRALRTTFGEPQGRPVQRVAARGGAGFEVVDAAGWDEAQVRARLDREAHRPFDLERGPLLRLLLCRRAAEEWLVLLVVHHLVADFWSLTVLLDELGRIYAAAMEGRPPSLEPLPLEYADYVAWQQRMLAAGEGDAHWRYWRERLAGPLPELALPTNRPRPPVQTYRGASLAIDLGGERTRALRELAAAHDCTLYTVLLAAFQTLLHRYSGQDDLVVGSPMSGRTQAALSGIVGYFVNPVVLRADLAGDPTFAAFLESTRERVLEAQEHQDYPFALLVERLQPERDPSRPPLFQVMFILQKAHRSAAEGLASLALGEAGEPFDLWGLPVESVALEERMAPFDLTLTMAESGGRLQASFEYSTDLFDRETIARLAEHFRGLIDAVLADPGGRLADLSFMAPAERRRLLVEWNRTAADYPRDVPIHRQFEERAASQPQAVALVYENREWTYDELDARANRLAHYLRRHGIDVGSRVGIYMERSPEMLVALLGVLKAGAAYVPLDPDYPRRRLAFMLEDSQAAAVLTQQRLLGSLPESVATGVCIDSEWPAVERESAERPDAAVSGEDLAYVIYTSGSTGRPKGVMIRHAAVSNFFSGMDRSVGCDATDTLLAVTSISFDISVLELFWTLTRGARVVLLSERAIRDTAIRRPSAAAAKSVSFSLFYFANADSDGQENKYRLLLEGARFADRHGFEAVWTPERHFHAFGGLYPSPSVIGAAVAVATERVQVRAGSVVLPLHDPVRVAEEWSVVDNLSQGRVGVSFASGWHVNDFVFAPEHWERRHQVMYRDLETVRRLWNGETVRRTNGAGEEIEVAIRPLPTQAELPIWVTAGGGNPRTFERAGEVGANLLTHLLGQSVEDLAPKISAYREGRARGGRDPETGRVTLMLHSFVGASMEAVREQVRGPLTQYLKTSVRLIASLVKGLDMDLDLEGMKPEDMEGLLAFALDRYLESSGLFGAPEDGLEMAERVAAAGVDEIACLIDFGVDADAVLDSLNALDEVRRRSHERARAQRYSLAALARRHRPTLFQCTPSLMKMLTLQPETLDSLGSLRALMLGGESLPPALAEEVGAALPARIVNMYGPTETTIWSTTEEIADPSRGVAIGRPIANTRVYVLDPRLEPVPPGVSGELYIGGDGLARGYLGRPALTAERFVPDPFGERPGGRLYRTGDLVCFLPDGRLRFLCRLDHQIKIRGFRIELGEIEAVLGRHPAVREAAVVADHEDGEGSRLVAYVVPAGGASESDDWRGFLEERLPDYMVPSAFVTLDALPLTPNGKLDRRALPAVEAARPQLATAFVAPEGELQRTVAEIWREVLKVEKVGIHDNFFDLGGHSLLMAQVHSHLKSRLQRDFPLVRLLEYPTVSALTRYLGRSDEESRPERRDSDRAERQRAGLWRQSRSAMAVRRSAGESLRR